jgi:hypothetical protein
MRFSTFSRALLCVAALSLAACGDSTTGSSSSTDAATSSVAGVPSVTSVIALSSAIYTVPASATSAVLTVERTGTPTGAVTVQYGTADGTAVAGDDYVPASGSLSWADGDQSPKTISVSISNDDSGKSFAVTLDSITGDANFGSPTTAMVALGGDTSDSSSSSSSGATTGSSSSSSSGGTATGSSSSGSTVKASANGTMIPSASRIVDSGGNSWTVSGGVIARNGTLQSDTHAVIVLVYYDAVIYQENIHCNWWSWTAGAWLATGEPAVAGIPACSSSVTSTDSDTSSSSSSSSSGGAKTSTGSSSSSSSSSSGGKSTTTTTSSTSSSSSSADVPAAAAAVGYNTLTFNSSTIGTTTGTWQRHNMEGCDTAPQAYSQNADGSIALSGYGNTCAGANLATATHVATATNWAGIAFGGGGYFEATMSFTGQGNGPYANGGPAFWAEDIEHFSGGPYMVGWPSIANPWNSGTSYALNAIVSFNNQMWISNVADNRGNAPPSGTGHANSSWRLYNNFFEVDFMEYDVNQYSYQNGIGNWWGNSEAGLYPGTGGGTHNPYEAVGGATGSVLVPNGTDFAQYHKYGCLWVPATPSTQGYLKFYFDGVQTGQTFYWDYYDPNDATTYPAAPPVNGSTAMSGMDWRHLFLMIGTGTTQPTTVKGVTVWQASNANNLIE